MTAILLTSFSVAAYPASAQEQPKRKLVAGVVTTIPYSVDPSELFDGPRELVELTTGRPELDWTPSFTPKSQTLQEMAKLMVLRRDIWNYEFSFKPLRMLYVDVPQPSGKMLRKPIWYLVFRVKNRGSDVRPIAVADQWGHEVFGAEIFDRESPRIFPALVLQGHEVRDKSGNKKEYLDRILPSAQKAINLRETPSIKLLNTVEITATPIPLSDDRVDRGVWGVATWEDVDPRLDYLSIYVKGLTNAYRFQDNYQAGSPPGSGRTFTYKTLQLNFWRPGDTVREHEEEIRYGVPLLEDPKEQAAVLEFYGQEKPVDFRWVYR